MQDLHVLKAIGVRIRQARLNDLQKRSHLSLDAYQVLGLKPNCSCNEAKTAYRFVLFDALPDNASLHSLFKRTALPELS